MGQPDPALLQIARYNQRTKETGTPPPLPPPRPPHEWYEKMYAKLFAADDNLYNTMTAADFEQQALPLLSLLVAVTRRLKIQPMAGGDSDPTSAVGWPDWFNEMQGMLISQPSWAWLQEECHRLLYMYACWHLASGEQDRSVFQNVPPAPPPPPPSKAKQAKEDVATKVVEATQNEESGGDTADSGYVEFHDDGSITGTVDESAAKPSWSQIPLIVCAAEDEGPGGAAARYRPPAGKPRAVPQRNKPKLPPNIEYLFRYLGKSGANATSMDTFVYREKALNTHVTRISEIGFGIGNWCGPASFMPVKEQLKKRYVYLAGLDAKLDEKWGYARRITFKHHPPSKVEAYLKKDRPDANRDDSGKFVRIEDLKVERGDIIWMINQVGPLSGHVATIIRSQDASGDECNTPAMVTWVSGNAGGAPRGCVRVQTVWRVPCEDDRYDYDSVSSLGNRRDERRVAYNNAVGEAKQKLQGSTDALGTSRGKVDEAALSEDQKKKLEATRSAEASLKQGTDNVRVRPSRPFTHWLVVIFKVGKLDLLGVAETYDPLMQPWLARRPPNRKGEPSSAALTDEEKALIESKNAELRPKMMMWTPPDSNRNGILIAAQSEVNSKHQAIAKPTSPTATKKY